ncbi:MAG: AEC family transporter [Candidatus Omnitrophica bacterium]|nr:AEC family transporter [Candidatus Omnitrophota bacterium]
MDKHFVDKLGKLLVVLIFPCLIAHRITSSFSFTELYYWWALPIAAVAFSALGLLLGFLFYGFSKDKEGKREFLCAAAFQNCGYLPMSVIFFMFDGAVRDKFLIMVFLYIIGFDLIMWSFVPIFLSGGTKLKEGFKNIFSPPVVVTIVSLLWVFFFGKGHVPDIVMDPVAKIGDTAFPLVMIVLGAYLSIYRGHLPEKKTDVFLVLVVRFLAFPALVLLAMKVFPMDAHLRFFLFLQSIMPVAVSLIIIGAYTNARNRFLSSVIFYSHLLGIFLIPLWLEIFKCAFKMK